MELTGSFRILFVADEGGGGGEEGCWVEAGEVEGVDGTLEGEGECGRRFLGFEVQAEVRVG